MLKYFKRSVVLGDRASSFAGDEYNQAGCSLHGGNVAVVPGAAAARQLGSRDRPHPGRDCRR